MAAKKSTRKSTARTPAPAKKASAPPPFVRSPGQKVPAPVVIAFLPDPAPTAPRSKGASGKGVVFKSPAFRLTVINELLDLGHFADGFEAAQAKSDEVEDYETDPRVQAFLDKLVLTEELLEQVVQIAPDGGDEIYAGLVPVWDGEDDRFDLDSLEDVRLLPSLARVSLYAMVKEGIDLAPLRAVDTLEVVNIALGGKSAVKGWEVLDALEARGVEVTRD